MHRAQPAHQAYAGAITLGIAGGARSGELVYAQRKDAMQKSDSAPEDTEGVAGKPPRDPELALVGYAGRQLKQ